MFNIDFVNVGLISVTDMYNVNIRDIGLVSSIPNVFSIISEVIAATVADHLRSKKILTIPNASNFILENRF